MSTKTTAEKLLIKPGTPAWASDPARLALVGPLPEGARAVDGPANADIALVFADDSTSLRATLDAHVDEDLHRPGAFWVVYPKGNRADINRDSLWPILAEHGMRPISQVSVDDTWSALRFRPLRPDEPPFAGGR
jgi:hypothetical protein